MVSNSKHINLNQTETDQYILNINMYKIIQDCTIRLYPKFLIFFFFFLRNLSQVRQNLSMVQVPKLNDSRCSLNPYKH